MKLANKKEKVIFIHKSDPTFVLIILYDEKKIYMSQRKNSTKLMYLKYQVSYGKVDKRKILIEAVQRETQEETGLRLPIKAFQYIKNDSNYNCDMYIVKLYEDEVPELIEPNNMTTWIYY